MEVSLWGEVTQSVMQVRGEKKTLEDSGETESNNSSFHDKFLREVEAANRRGQLLVYLQPFN